MTRAVRSLTLPATLEHLEELTGMVSEHLEAHGVSEKDLFEVDLAVDEACTNVIKYAYGPRGGSVHLECLVTDSEVCVCITDSGRPFNPLEVEVPDLTAELDDRPIGGLGVHLIRSLMNEVKYEYRDGRNVLCMTRTRTDRSCG
jgi:serine/threonine-protein kinase RsbW